MLERSFRLFSLTSSPPLCSLQVANASTARPGGIADRSLKRNTPPSPSRQPAAAAAGRRPPPLTILDRAEPESLAVPESPAAALGSHGSLALSTPSPQDEAAGAQRSLGAGWAQGESPRRGDAVAATVAGGESTLLSDASGQPGRPELRRPAGARSTAGDTTDAESLSDDRDDDDGEAAPMLPGSGGAGRRARRARPDNGGGFDSSPSSVARGAMCARCAASRCFRVPCLSFLLPLLAPLLEPDRPSFCWHPQARHPQGAGRPNAPPPLPHRRSGHGRH